MKTLLRVICFVFEDQCWLDRRTGKYRVHRHVAFRLRVVPERP